MIKKGEYEILVDGGPAETSEKVVNFLKGKVQGNLEIIISTHADKEHWGGLVDVVDNFNVKELWWNGLDGILEYGDFINDTQNRGIIVKKVKRGDEINANGADILILNPPTPTYPSKDTSSISLRVGLGNFCVLLFSDTV